MSIHNVGNEINQALALNIISKTTTATLTYAELTSGIPFVRCTTASGAYVITLPAAADLYKGVMVYIGNYGHQTNDITVNVVAGFGGDADIDDVVVDAGEFGIFFCDGSRWFANGSTIPQA